MKKIFYTGLAGISVFEILNVYFIMPMPGSQEMNSIAIAYFLYSWRWVFRVVFGSMVLMGVQTVFTGKRKWIPALPLLLTAAIVYLFNFKMTAENMFLQAEKIVLKPASENRVAGDRLVIGIENNGEAKAYPVAILAYHHQVRDTVGGKQVMVTYCSVCRTGRVYEPIVNGHYENFRLVGMDHFNAMFEDAGTGSWWRQSTGQAVAGSLKGKILPELESEQMTVDKWFELYPNGRIMQADESFLAMYDSAGKFEKGLSRGSLTRTDSLSWKDKSWVVGIRAGNSFKAYDWNYLKQTRIINDSIGDKSVMLILSSDAQSFAAFERPASRIFTLSGDTILSDTLMYDFSGQNLADSTEKLQRINAYQEFWHSWVTFHPNTEQYPVSNLNSSK